jgi:hypothetical protein
VVPQALPAWIAATLYRFEANLRASTVLGMVGAGGIGFELFSNMKLFQYHDTAACVFVILTRHECGLSVFEAPRAGTGRMTVGTRALGWSATT